MDSEIRLAEVNLDLARQLFFSYSSGNYKQSELRGCLDHTCGYMTDAVTPSSA